jgi:putative zinc finger protein
VNHQEAIAQTAVERYLLDEMSPPQRDDFEEHYFGCTECATELRATATFLDAAKHELRAGAVLRPGPAPRKTPWWAIFGKPVFLSAACAALLAVVAVQNLAVFPRSAGANAPEVLPTLSLVGGDTRGGEVSRLPLNGAHAFMLNVDVPADESYSNYACALLAPSGATLWRVPISRTLAKDTVSIRIPATGAVAGTYTLVVQGMKSGTESPIDLAHYRFTTSEQ